LIHIICDLNLLWRKSFCSRLKKDTVGDKWQISFSTFCNKNWLKTCVKLKINSNLLQQHKKITVNSQNVFRFSLLPSSILVLDFGAKLHTILVINVSFRVSKFLYLFKFYLWIHFSFAKFTYLLYHKDLQEFVGETC